MKALVIGTAPAVLVDLKRINLKDFDRIYAANYMQIALRIVPDVWVSQHPENMTDWQNEITHLGMLLPSRIICGHAQKRRVKGEPRIDQYVDRRWLDMPDGLLVDSGLLSVKTALDDGADSIVVAGVRLNRSGNLNLISPRGHDYGRFLSAWKWAAENKFEGKVRAMGGTLLALLGGPDGIHTASA